MTLLFFSSTESIRQLIRLIPQFDSAHCDDGAHHDANILVRLEQRINKRREGGALREDDEESE